MDALPTWLYILTIIIGGLGGIAGVVSAMTANRTITAQRDKLEAEAVKIRAEAKQSKPILSPKPTAAPRPLRWKS